MSDVDDIFIHLVNKHSAAKRQEAERQRREEEIRRQEARQHLVLRSHPSNVPRTSSAPKRRRPMGVVKRKIKKYRKIVIPISMLFALLGVVGVVKGIIPNETPNVTVNNKDNSAYVVHANRDEYGGDYTFEDSTVISEPVTDDHIVESANPYANPEDHIHIQHWSNGSDYYTCDEDYVLYLSEQAIESIKNTILQINPESKFLDVLDAGYIDPYLITATAFRESSYRYMDTDGVILHNGDTAFGMTQGTHDTMDTINNAFKVYGVNFNEESLKDPQTALEFTTYIYMYNSYYKLNDIIDLTDPANKEFLQWFCACSYFHGGGGAKKFMNEGTLTEQSYPKKIMAKRGELAEKYSSPEMGE